MKRLKNLILPVNLAAGAFLLSSIVNPLHAQDPDKTSSSTGKSNSKIYTSSSNTESHSSEIPRVWFGLTGSYLPFKFVTAKTNTNSTTGEVISSTAANGQAGGGADINWRIYGSYWLSVGTIFRFGGYDTQDAVNSTTIYLERTRARFFDFPVLVRYNGPHLRWSRFAFYELGPTLRYATDIKLQQAANNGTSYYCCAPASTTAIHRDIEGITVGTGVSGKDEFGIIASPEIRYTYWIGNTFSSPTVSTMRNQLEVTLSFGW